MSENRATIEVLYEQGDLIALSIEADPHQPLLTIEHMLKNLGFPSFAEDTYPIFMGYLLEEAVIVTGVFERINQIR